jgi:uncharacterized protein
MGMSVRRWIWGSLMTTVVLLIAAGGWVVSANHFAIREEKVTISGGTQPLKGVLAWPEHGHGPYGLVVFVHGDGPVDATGDTLYAPIWESLARAGYASLSWNKPGVDGAPGNWLHQSMQDRANETIAAINWARTRPGIDPHRIGLWGASQGGWVMPKVAWQSPDVRFIIAVSPAINVDRQSRYNMLAELRTRHASSSEIKTKTDVDDRYDRALRSGETYDQFRAEGGDVRGVSRDRWEFESKLISADASADLAKVRVPVLLILGGHDLNVDVADTEAGYRRTLRAPGQLRIRHYPTAVHQLIPKSIWDSKIKTYVIAAAAPRSLYAPGFLRDQRQFLESLGR